MPTNIKVLGVGNILLSDEGVGVKAVWELKNNYKFFPEISLVDGGTGGIFLLSEFEGVEKLIIVDAISGGNPPGTIYNFSFKEIPKKIIKKLSLHDIGLEEILALAELKNCLPKEIRIIGIEPAVIEWGDSLSDIIKTKFPLFIKEILLQLEKWGIKAVAIKTIQTQEF